MASRVGTMVGSQVLTHEYASREISRLDSGDLIARAAERLTRGDLNAAAWRAAVWIAEQLPALPAGDLSGLSRRLIAEWPIALALATALDVARKRGWHRRVIDGLARVLADAVERPAVQETRNTRSVIVASSRSEELPRQPASETTRRNGPP